MHAKVMGDRPKVMIVVNVYTVAPKTCNESHKLGFRRDRGA
jgi:hypothetical protein